MNIKVKDLMTEGVFTLRPHQTAGYAKKTLIEQGISCLPVVGTENEPVGIVTSRDVLDEEKAGKPVSQFMTEKVLTIAEYSDVSVAARIMRNHHIHHVVVTKEKEVVGVISSYDLLQLVEEHRFVLKNPPTTSKKGGAYAASAE